MALSKEIVDELKAWIRNNPLTKERCQESNGRPALIANLMGLQPGVARKAVNSQITYHLGTLLGVRSNQHTKPGLTQNANGGLVNQALNAKNNPKYNPVNAKKRKDANDANNRQIISNLNLQHLLLSKQEVDEEAKRHFETKKFQQLDNQTMKEALESNTHSVCIGSEVHKSKCYACTCCPITTC
jgi:hypothetical protein